MNNITRAKSEKTEYQQQKLRRWCDKTWPELYRYIYYRVQNREEAEDVTQETYARALAKFPAPDNLPTVGYLRTVALNLIRDRWRRQKAHGTLVPLEENLFPINNDADEALNRTFMQELLDKLSEEQRLVLQLRIVEGYSRAETAKKMGCSEDAVRGLQYRAVQALRNLMLQSIEGVDN